MYGVRLTLSAILIVTGAARASGPDPALLSDLLGATADASLAPPRDVDPVINVPPDLEGRVGFWVDVVGLYTLRDLLVHDLASPESIVAVYRLPEQIKARSREARLWVRRVDRLHRAAYRAAADDLDAGRPVDDPLVTGLYVAKRAAADTAFAAEAAEELRRLSRKMRTQNGLKEVFAESFRRSGRLFDPVRAILTDEGIPPILAYLPFLESGYDPTATSHLNAGGLWQFTRATGRQYLQINDVVDERYDPILATHAAAAYLRAARDTLGSWPLAITSYNYGMNGTLRAVANHGTDLMDVLLKHDGRSMGFAARNFYAEFVAISRVMTNPERYFPDLLREPTWSFDVIRLDAYIDVRDLAEHIETDLAMLLELNPGFRSPVWKGERRVPPGYPVRVPAMDFDVLAERIQTFPTGVKHASQTLTGYHRIRPGDALAKIAARYRTSVAHLLELNELDDPHRIFAGQRLRLPR